MCIAHPQIVCKCEQVRLPILGSNDAWCIMKNRFKLVHGAPKAVEPSKVPPILKSILPAPTRKGGNHVNWATECTGRVYGAAINPLPDRRSMRGIHRTPTPAPKPKRSPFTALPTCAVQRHTSKRLPVTRNQSCNEYTSFNTVTSNQLFIQHYKNKSNYSTHARHVRN